MGVTEAHIAGVEKGDGGHGSASEKRRWEQPYIISFLLQIQKVSRLDTDKLNRVEIQFTFTGDTWGR